jgi:hypothetical protein
LFRQTPTLAVQEQCLPTNFISFTIFVLFYRIIAIFNRGRGTGGGQWGHVPPPTFLKSDEVPHLKNEKSILERKKESALFAVVKTL